jgi:hypothetical protein
VPPVRDYAFAAVLLTGRGDDGGGGDGDGGLPIRRHARTEQWF